MSGFKNTKKWLIIAKYKKNVLQVLDKILKIWYDAMFGSQKAFGQKRMLNRLPTTKEKNV